MDQERNPNKNAELSMEQNYNQIDGIINNLPVPPRRISRWTRYGNIRPSAAAGSVRSVDKEARPQRPHLCVGTPDELEVIRERMAEAGIRNMSAYIRKMALGGYVLHVDLEPSRSLCRSSGAVQTISIRRPSMPTAMAACTRTS